MKVLLSVTCVILLSTSVYAEQFTGKITDARLVKSEGCLPGARACKHEIHLTLKNKSKVIDVWTDNQSVVSDYKMYRRDDMSDFTVKYEGDVIMSILNQTYDDNLRKSMTTEIESPKIDWEHVREVTRQSIRSAQ